MLFVACSAGSGDDPSLASGDLKSATKAVTTCSCPVEDKEYIKTDNCPGTPLNECYNATCTVGTCTTNGTGGYCGCSVVRTDGVVIWDTPNEVTEYGCLHYPPSAGTATPYYKTNTLEQISCKETET
jgi:hypothetical protein